MQFLKNVGAVLKAVIVAIGKLLHLLLIKLYLLIPVLYVLAIWIASLCVPFRMGDYASYIIVGAALCLALSALLLLRKYMLGGKKADKKASTYVSATTVATAAPTEQTSEQAENARTDAEDALAQAATTQAAPTAEPTPEQPRYYRTRKDPTLYIAEYSDRLEFFRKMPEGGYLYIATEPKENSTY